MNSPEEFRKFNQLREERQELLDKRYRLLKKCGTRTAAEESQIRRWENRMDAIDRELDRITGTRNNWRKDISSNQ